MTVLSEHYFGDLEAFDEASMNPSFFRNTFITPKSLSTTTLRNNRKFIIVGRKGVGKTAIQMHFAEELRNKGYFTHHFRFFYDLRSDDYADISKTQSDISYTIASNSKNLFLHYDFRDVWERVFFRRLGENLRERGHRNSFTEMVAPAGSKFSNIFDGLTKSLNIKLSAPIGPLMAEVGFDISSQPIQTEIPLKTFNKVSRELFKRHCSRFRMYFFIDELVFSRLNATEDEITLRAAMVRDIVRTSWELNSFCYTNELSFHFICSLRPEIRNLINDYDAEAGKMLDGKDVELSWLVGDGEEGKLILDVIKAKVEFSHENNVVFEEFMAQEISFNERKDSIEEFLVRNTWGRPRDVVRLLNSIAKKSPNSPNIGVDEIKLGLSDYSRASAKELIDELGVRYGSTILDALRKGIARQVYNDRESFWDAIQRHLGGVSAPGLLDELFNLGFIGGYEPTKGRHHWAYRGSSYLQPHNKIRIHPALWSEFQIQ